ncbi:MAG TPA: lanthionine synthetase C family protein [Thermoanaerobaculia bacterium]|nr:lanthionine synthetase C family protein [Thermoanaerobaculia bacterium]
MTEPNSNRPWRPLLTGEAARAANAAVDAIAAGIAAHPAAAAIRPEAGGGHFSLAGGQAGLALFFSYLHFARPDGGHDETAMGFLEQAIEGTGEMAVSAGLYSGFAGVAWTLEHLLGRLFDPDGEDPGEEIATALQGLLARSPWQGDYDLISGLVGFGAYALERLPRPGGRECLEQIVARLSETAEPGAAGITWHTPPERVGPVQAEQFPAGYYNLGVAHGVPGVIALLGEAEVAGLAAEVAAEARRLRQGAAAWIATQQLPPGAPSLFPYNTAPGIPPSPSRLAWCYGDLGIAAALLAAARTVADPGLEATARTVAGHAAARPAEGAGVVDAGLCHGAAGVAHLFNRLYQASGEAAVGEAARSWFERALALRGPEGIGGFRAWLPQGNDGMSGELGWADDPGFLTGSAGIGLALLAATTPVEPNWDRVLLTAIRGASGRREP